LKKPSEKDELALSRRKDAYNRVLRKNQLRKSVADEALVPKQRNLAEKTSIREILMIPHRTKTPPPVRHFKTMKIGQIIRT
jgi:hypothetical protein